MLTMTKLIPFFLVLLGSLAFSDSIAQINCAYNGQPPEAVGRLRGDVRVMTHNVFGKPSDSAATCRARLSELGRFAARSLPRYDVLAFQENWNSSDGDLASCGADELHKAVVSGGRYSGKKQYYRWYPEGEAQSLEVDGGITTYSEFPISKFTENEWDEIPRTSGFKILHGSVFARIPLQKNGITIDLYNVHLLARSDGCDRACRRRELEELRREIEVNSKSSGNPVVVVGDFNIGGPPSCSGNPGYSDIMEVLDSPRDIWFEAYGQMNGATVDCLNNTTLQAVTGCEGQERIDYIFVGESPALSNSPYRLTLASRNELKLLKIRTATGWHVSDHFGLAAGFEIRDAATPDAQFRSVAGPCLETAGGQTRAGTTVQVFECNGTEAQRWTLNHTGHLVGRGGRCVSVSSWNIEGSAVQLADCKDEGRQQFNLSKTGELRVRGNAAMCLTASALPNRSPIIAARCDGRAQQQWVTQ
jgi:endonuclease/exonuclease/phosphatase family metal-dependent hydrolase